VKLCRFFSDGKFLLLIQSYYVLLVYLSFLFLHDLTLVKDEDDLLSNGVCIKEFVHFFSVIRFLAYILIIINFNDPLYFCYISVMSPFPF
jgi:hypothetical protein